MLYEVITDVRTRMQTLNRTFAESGLVFYSFEAVYDGASHSFGKSQKGAKAVEGGRITSYNVCYTKLLRTFAAVADGLGKLRRKDGFVESLRYNVQ